jgi:hypothetical protein
MFIAWISPIKVSSSVRSDMFNVYYIPLLTELDSISNVSTINISLLTELREYFAQDIGGFM